MQIPPIRPRFLSYPLAIALLLGLPGIAAARDQVIVDPYYEYRDDVGRGEYSYDDSQDIPWIENETEVLAVPRPEDLQPVQLDTLQAGFEVLVDLTRITVDPDDRVVRGWFWVRSAAGAENGSFEGFRCETREYKVYAYAYPRRDPPVSKAKRPLWKAVNRESGRDYRAELLDDYFCGIRGTRSAREIVQYMTGEFRRERFLSE